LFSSGFRGEAEDGQAPPGVLPVLPEGRGAVDARGARAGTARVDDDQPVAESAGVSGARAELGDDPGR
jgi:hypothetical protein